MAEGRTDVCFRAYVYDQRTDGGTRSPSKVYALTYPAIPRFERTRRRAYSLADEHFR